VIKGKPQTIHANQLAVDALQLMEEKKISVLFVTDKQDNDTLTGIIHMQDLLKAGIV
jgi:arabinose-5-phosphate isomerase